MTAPATEESPARPRMEPWPIAIIAFFVVAVLVVVFFVAWSASQPFELVDRDYYAREIAFQQQIDGMERAIGRPTPVRIRMTEAGDAIDIDLGVSAGVDTGDIRLYRPSNAAWDRKVPLAPTGDGTQRIDAAGRQPGLWKVRIEWTQDGETIYAEDAVTIGRSL